MWFHPPLAIRDMQSLCLQVFQMPWKAETGAATQIKRCTQMFDFGLCYSAVNHFISSLVFMVDVHVCLRVCVFACVFGYVCVCLFVGWLDGWLVGWLVCWFSRVFAFVLVCYFFIFFSVCVCACVRFPSVYVYSLLLSCLFFPVVCVKRCVADAVLLLLLLLLIFLLLMLLLLKCLN